MASPLPLEAKTASPEESSSSEGQLAPPATAVPSTPLAPSSSSPKQLRSNDVQGDDKNNIILLPRRSSLRESLRTLQRSVGLDRPPRDYYDGGGEAGLSGVQLWHVAVGVIAVVDCIANLLAGSDEGMTMMLETFEGQSQVAEHGGGGEGDLLSWLRMRRAEIDVCFSLAWMVDSIVVARFVRVPRCERLHREGVRSMRIDEARDAVRDCQGGTMMGSPWVVYLRVVSFHLLVLPIGVYVHLYNAVVDPTQRLEKLPALGGKGGRPTCVDSLWSNTRRSFVVAIVECYAARAVRASQIMKATGKAQLHAMAIRKVLSNVHRPRQLWRQVQHVLRVLRWLTYILTMLGPLGNLMDRVGDFRKRYRQRREARAALKERRQRLTCMDPVEAKAHCARRVQATFRSKRARRNVKALQTLRRDEERLAALKMQRALQASLARARRRIKEEHDQFHAFRKEQREVARREKRRMSMKERQYLHQMEKELSEESLKLLNHTLLIRPHSRFLFFWNFIMVLCALLEILTLASVLRSGHDIPASMYSKNRHQFETIVIKTFTSAPAARLKSCQELNRCPSSGSGFDFRFRQAACWFRNRTERGRTTHPTHPPRHCSPLASRVQQLYISTVPGVSRAALKSFITISNLDVFVKFFTGDIDPWTGSLRPRSFVKRWIFPGLLLQLILNPQVELTSDFLAHVFSAVVQHGPYRIFCWMAAFAYPTLRAFRSTLLSVWIQMLDESNTAIA